MESAPADQENQGPKMQEEIEVCPYISRMGVCLEPKACMLCHRTMNIGAKEFVPGQGGAIPEWNPDEGAANIPTAMQDPGIKFEVIQDEDFEAELMFVESRKDCKCCQGYVNTCSGVVCANLGICYCMVADDEDVALQID